MNKIRRLSSNSHHQSSRFQESDDDSAIYQRQLQQLFSLHDSGLDQSTIDALPVFVYNQLINGGFKGHHHCAVCLCEFTEHENLRLLPVCSHAFHTHCIDTWLLSNSTCPLCRGTLFTPGFSFINPVFDFGFDIGEDDELSNSNNTHDGVSGESETVYPVRLGKFRAIEAGQTSNGNLDERRCYSMGSYEYVVANTDLQVAFCSDKGRIGNSDLRSGKEISNGSKGESFSVSKIWLWSKKDHQNTSIPLSM
ncbi:hypothetical protein QVD17_29516 [Tagetes erecta]|uniref:RING-type E3 ubiquitin transferase n=1 Tax=Tagetes erecta TaxID=13708 RepID=A0AAD8KBX8_TARER|nr:hypothetical protein QVD17_29516 [Tagetes erecta]